jgi:hypothetical protein
MSVSERTEPSKMSSCVLKRIQTLMRATTVASPGSPV